ncbi:hypothetical protein [Bogoriella caseilytica]|uniref:Uncharacterized protein n=1 Tax=Bogoriella caseilytica TaxID=56055 RepID=A0A3N2BA01_9MICO|nr:hypothetical protein [Bogoriella caseilytica]ROR72077.1 hypothetical protein EDD31_0423 [Bogoriella caseilytica]
MIRRILAVTLIVLGLAAAAAGTASATIWRPDDTATITLPSRPDVPVVITSPGVLEAIGSEVQVRATAGADEPVVVAFGVPEDVEAWAEPADHLRVTGFASWEEFEVTEVPGEPAPAAEGDEGAQDEGEATEDDAEQSTAGLPDPAVSDLWIHQESGTGSVDFTWEERPGRWAMLVATDGSEPAPDLEFTWDVEVSTPYLLPGLALGLLLLCLGVAWLIGIMARDRRRRRRAERRRALMDARADETAVFTAIRDEDGPPLGTAAAAPEVAPEREGASALDERPRSRRARRRSREMPAEGSEAAKDELAEYAGEAPAASEQPAAEQSVTTAPAGAASAPGRAESADEPATPSVETVQPDAEPAPITRRQARSRGADGSGWRSAWGLGPASTGSAAVTPRWQSTGAQHDDDQSSEGKETP